MLLSFDGAAVRVVTREGELWFVAADVAGVLVIGRTEDAGRRLDDDEKGTDTIRTLHNTQGITESRNGIVKLINESGLYSLVLTSRKPEEKGVISLRDSTGRMQDAADILGYADTTKATKRHCRGGGVSPPPSNRRLSLW